MRSADSSRPTWTGDADAGGRPQPSRPTSTSWASSSRGHLIPARKPVALLLSWGLSSQPRSPKCLGYRIAAGGHGIASGCARLGGSETFLRSRWAEFGACCRRPRCRGIIEPHRQRDPTSFRLDLQHLDTDNIAGLRNLARVLDVRIGHCGDVHQPVLVNPHIGRRRQTRRRSSRDRVDRDPRAAPCCPPCRSHA